MIRLRIREAAEQKRVTGEQLSRLTGLDIETIERVLTYPGLHISTYALGLLADALGVDACTLIDYTAEPSARDNR